MTRKEFLEKRIQEQKKYLEDIKKNKSLYSFDRFNELWNSAYNIFLILTAELRQLKEKDYVFAVTAYRWGNRENHSYLIGVFNDRQAAIKAADRHVSYRGGKYSCCVELCKIGHYDEDLENKNKPQEIYFSKGLEL